MSNSNAAPWYETWFDSPHYHTLYGHRSQGEASDFIQTLHDVLQWDTLELLDLACGKGRHAAAASKLGHKVVGIDLSPNSIHQARTDHEEGEGLSFLQGDMRDFTLNTRFDGVLNLFTSFGYFEQPKDQLQVLKQVKAHLQPGGFFILDFLNLGHARAKMVALETIERGSTKYHIERHYGPLNPNMEGFVKTISFEADGQQHRHSERVAGLDKSQLYSMLKEAGFSVQSCFGDYDLSPWHPVKSPRLILNAIAS